MRNAYSSAIWGAALLLVAGAAQAGPAQPEAKAQPISQQLICRAPVDNGLLITRGKQCYTKAEWDARHKRMQDSLRQYQMQNLLQNNR